MYSKDVKITVYKTIDDMSRIQYGDHVIQIYGYNENSEVKLQHFIIDRDGEEVEGFDCLLDAFNYIDNI